MNENGLSAADVALLTGNNNNDGWGGNGMGGLIWILALLALMGGGFGGGWGGNGYHPQYATQDFVQNGLNFNDLQDQNRDIMNAITNGTAQSVAAAKEATAQSVAAAKEAEYESIAVAKDIQSTIISQIGDVRTNQMQLLANQNQCYEYNDTLAA